MKPERFTAIKAYLAQFTNTTDPGYIAIAELITEVERLQAIEQAAQKYITADGPDTYPAYQEFRGLIIASL